MHGWREPILKPVPITELKPTQITIGMREVSERRRHWRDELSKKKRLDFLQRHLIPVILGPRGAHYIIDHHHMALALSEEGMDHMWVIIRADLSRLDDDTFWFIMDQSNWMHPFDEHGRRCSYRRIPKSIDKLIDDPYRSLAGELRRIGGFAKDTTPFSEFLWADFLRRRIESKVVQRDFSRALKAALKLAKKKEADYLPGWCGPVVSGTVRTLLRPKVRGQH